MVDHDAIIDGIVSPMTAGDPSTSRGPNDAMRPAGLGDANEVFMVTGGTQFASGVTRIGNADANTDTVLNMDELDKDDKQTTDMTKSLPGQFLMKDGSEGTLGDFTGSVHERVTMDGKQTDTIAVFTDMDAPKNLTYAAYYNDDSGTGAGGIGTAAASRDGVGSADADGVLTFLNTALDKASLFYGPGIPTAPSTFLITDGDDDPMTDADETTFDGMFNGVAGEYSCGTTTDGCRAEQDADGKLTLTGRWTFDPDGDITQIKIPGANNDADYLSFGYWVRAVEGDDKTTYQVGAFFAGSEVVVPSTFVDLRGDATYSGNAAGMYAKKTLAPNGDVTDAISGHFTADASLTAYFGGDDIANSKQYTIGGKVTNLMDGGQLVDAGWTVELNSAYFDGQMGAGQGTYTDTFNGTTTGKGLWMGQFFGTPETSATPTEDHPTGVAGEFTGHFANGHVIGAFGATR